MLVWLLSLSSQADPTWDLIQQGRPGLARQRVKSPSLLQSAQLAQAEGDVGEAWRLLRQLEATYQPGRQPPEFFWLRAQLLRDSRWNLAEQNLHGVVAPSSPPGLRLLGLLALAQGLDARAQTAQADEYWVEAAHLASEMQPQRGAWVIHVALAQADRQIQKDRHDQSLMTLVNARALAQSEKLPALLALVQLKVAETEAELADWEAFADNCEAALHTAAGLSEAWLIERICTYWVDQQLLRSTDQAQARRCLKTLQTAEKTLRGPSRLHLLSQLARLQALGLNQRAAGLATLDRAVELCPPNKLEVRLLAERYLLTPTSDQAGRRRQLLHIQADLARLGPLQPEDEVAQKLPPYGIWAALAETYLPQQPEQADQLFDKALALSPDRTARLRVLCFQMNRCAQLGAMTAARRSLQQLLELIKSSPLDEPALALVRAQMVDLDGGSRHLAQLFLTDDLRPRAESPVMVFLQELLADSELQLRLDREVYDQIRRAKSPQESCRAYLDRARLLLAQGRGPEASLAVEKMGDFARKGGLSQQEAQALRMQAELRWSMGLYDRAIEACRQAELLYASSASAQDQQEGQNCRRLRAYFWLRSGRAAEALPLCQDPDAWSIFLSGRCLLELKRRSEAEQAFARCHFQDDLSELGRLVFQARCSEQPDSLYQAAYELAKRKDSLLVREVCLDWAASLRRAGREAEALKLEEETRARLTRLFLQYPAEVRERLLDQPLTQRLFPSHRDQPLVDSRQSRRSFLARLNEVRQRYPRMDNEMGVSPSDLVALQEIMPADRVLVQYFAGEADLYAMRVDSQGCRLIQMAVEKEVLRGWIQEVRLALSQRKPLPERAAHRLHAALVASLGPELEGKQVQVIPGGLFWYLPWDVLKDGQDRYLVETLEWSCVSPSELLRSRFANQGSAKVGQLVALGGSNPDLPATGEEARMVSSLFSPSQALVGAQANSQELIRWAPQADILHLATHSGVSASLNQSYIELSDGPFTLEQVYGLHLRPRCRVVLSSCESALGQSDPGREVSSLATAFLVGGASSVVATLWRVEDDTSMQFFRRYYARLLQSGSTSKALRQARLDSLAEPPWGWGAYQLIGQP
ncbi:MAG: CHAT domain-containing protein [Candidatus Eremiobacteraeota bacterium]|nr:CHAT domain-containing protein [Candidatus Eremiobacteraeota bacterium]MCW5872466.1 CHAT domain-containing protein [Candidatus Eremiobacteraeota bacterium]